ncbi:MAG TPA: zf-TFIIB domain-containing protein [Pyrinomonadaceae bacterium]|nr:zf-TFIIB domain-containing protein [Pyrinomonadaceae bacterium]
MSDIFDDRRRGLEEEYFNRKNREALEKLRAKRATEGASGRAEGARLCPLGHGPLAEVAVGNVFVDRCEQCHGIWLDEGELERITRGEAEGGNWLSDLLGLTGDNK